MQERKRNAVPDVPAVFEGITFQPKSSKSSIIKSKNSRHLAAKPLIEEFDEIDIFPLPANGPGLRQDLPICLKAIIE